MIWYFGLLHFAELPEIFEALRHPELVDGPLRELFDHLAAGRLRVVEGETYPLSEARRAHEDLQARRTR